MDAPTAKAMDAGYAAYFDGKRPADNPHPYGTEPVLALAWSRGFNQGRTAQWRANRAKTDGTA